MKGNRTHMLTVLLAVCAAAPAVAQFGSGPSIPSIGSALLRVGIGASGGVLLSQGTLSTQCNCVFESGNGYAFGGGASAEYRVLPSIWIALEAGIAQTQMRYSADFQKLRYVSNGEQVLVSVERAAVLDRTLAVVTLTGRWYPGLGALSLKIGPSAAFLLGGTYTETEDLKTPPYVYASTGTSRVTIYDGDFDGYYHPQAAQYGVLIGAGYDLFIGPSLSLLPEVNYTYAITGLAAGKSGWKIGGVNLHMALMFAF